MARAECIIVSANIPTLDMNQLSIVTHVNMMMNKTLLEEVYKDFEKIFKLSYVGAITEIRKIQTQLMTSGTRKYDSVSTEIGSMATRKTTEVISVLKSFCKPQSTKKSKIKTGGGEKEGGQNRKVPMERDANNDAVSKPNKRTRGKT